MRTNDLIKLHQRSVLELKLINETEKRIQTLERLINAEERKDDLHKYLFYSKTQYEARILQQRILQERIKRWYFQTKTKLK